jgi:hypothetical protein
MLNAVLLVVALLSMYGVWLYNRRVLGLSKLLLAPATWLAIFLATVLLKAYILQNSPVSGYSHQEAWISMNDNPHPESWEVNYSGESWPYLFVFIAPILSAILLRVFDGWVFRHFVALGIIAWMALLFVTCDGPPKEQYYDKNTLPPIGSSVRDNVHKQ